MNYEREVKPGPAQLIEYVDMDEDEYKKFIGLIPAGGYDDLPTALTVQAWNGLSRFSFIIRVNGRELSLEDRQRWRLIWKEVGRKLD